MYSFSDTHRRILRLVQLRFEAMTVSIQCNLSVSRGTTRYYAVVGWGLENSIMSNRLTVHSFVETAFVYRTSASLLPLSSIVIQLAQ